jgi:hypothetical protein
MTHHVLNIATNGGVEYIDLAYEMSRLNHRLYRQGRVYHADIVMTNTMAAGVPITVETIAPTWMNTKAWQLAFESWRKSTAAEREAGVKSGRWNDFRIYYEAAHTGTPAIVNGEYQYTTVHDTGAASGSRSFQMFGASSVSRWGVLSEYDSLRDTDTDTPPSGGSSIAYNTILAELDNQQADQLQEEGDEPPYNSVNLNATVQTFNLRSPTESNYYRTGLIQVPCGLIKLDSTGTGAIQVRIKPGKYKGVHAEAMS